MYPEIRSRFKFITKLNTAHRPGYYRFIIYSDTLKLYTFRCRYHQFIQINSYKFNSLLRQVKAKVSQKKKKN